MKLLSKWTLEEVRDKCESRLNRDECADCPMRGHLCFPYLASPGVSTHNPDEWEFES